jgi:hypothetical protein
MEFLKYAGFSGCFSANALRIIDNCGSTDHQPNTCSRAVTVHERRPNTLTDGQALIRANPSLVIQV